MTIYLASAERLLEWTESGWEKVDGSVPLKAECRHIRVILAGVRCETQQDSSLNATVFAAEGLVRVRQVSGPGLSETLSLPLPILRRAAGYFDLDRAFSGLAYISAARAFVRQQGAGPQNALTVVLEEIAGTVFLIIFQGEQTLAVREFPVMAAGQLMEEIRRSLKDTPGAMARRLFTTHQALAKLADENGWDVELVESGSIVELGSRQAGNEPVFSLPEDQEKKAAGLRRHTHLAVVGVIIVLAGSVGGAALMISSRATALETQEQVLMTEVRKLEKDVNAGLAATRLSRHSAQSLTRMKDIYGEFLINVPDGWQVVTLEWTGDNDGLKEFRAEVMIGSRGRFKCSGRFVTSRVQARTVNGKSALEIHSEIVPDRKKGEAL